MDQLILINLNDNPLAVLESLRFWVSTIKTFTTDNGGGRAPIILVGTRSDEVDKDKIKVKFSEVKKVIQIQNVNCIAINNAAEIDITKSQDHDPEDLKELREMILNCGLGIADEKLPARWIDLNIALDKKRSTGTTMISFEDLQKMDERIDVSLGDDESIKSFLEHFHCRGQLMYFPEDGKSDLILLEPTLLVKFLNKLMRTTESKDVSQAAANHDQSNQDGMVSKEYILQAAKELVPSGHVHKLPGILKRLKIVYEYKANAGDIPFYILPGLLPQFEPGTSESPCEKGPKLKITFSENHLNSGVPIGFFHHLLVAIMTDIEGVNIMEVEQKLQIYKTFACLQYLHIAVLVDISWERDVIYVHINSFASDVQLKDKGLDGFVRNIEKCIRTTMDIYRHTNAAYFLGVECPQHQDCYLDMKKLRESGKDMCKNRHLVVEGTVLPAGKATTTSLEHEVTIQDIKHDVNLIVDQVSL